MDAGCYPISLIRHVMGSEPTVIRASARTTNSSQIDRWMTADLTFANGCTGQITCAMRSQAIFQSYAAVRGTTGKLQVINPYQPQWVHCLKILS